MAAQNRKGSAGKKRQTAKRGSSSGRKNTGRNSRNQNQGPDLLTIVVVLAAVILVVVLLSKYNKEQEEDGTVTPTGSVTATGTLVPENPTEEPGEATKVPEPTKTVTNTPKPQPTPEPTPTEVPTLTQAQAEAIVKKIVHLDKYSIELLDDHLMIDGAEYFSFCINDGDGKALEPLLIVEKEEGMLLCYDLSGVVAPIERFPLDKTETGNEGSKVLSAKEAEKVLTGYSGERLGLPKETSEYEMVADDWTTMADGVECYGFSFFETVDGKQKFRGTFYVALNGSAVYSQDDITGEFIKR